MATIVGALAVKSTANTVHTITVPSGVTSTMNALIAFGNNDSTWTAGTAVSSSGATWSLLNESQATNMWVSVWTGTGMTAGDTVTITLASGESIAIYDYYTSDYSFNSGAGNVAVGNRGGVSQTTTTSGSLTPSAGQTVVLVALERTTAIPTVVSSVTSSGGETVTQIGYGQDDTGAEPDVSIYFGSFTASAAAARTATITYDDASGNGYAALVTTTSTVPGPGQNQFPSAVTAGSWTNVGGAASAVAALSDALATTYMQSPTPPSSGTPLLLTMGPIGAGGITFYVEGATGGGTATRTVTVYKADGTTQIYTTSYAITTTTAEQAVTLDSAALAAIPTLPDRTALVVQIVDVPA